MYIRVYTAGGQTTLYSPFLFKLYIYAGPLVGIIAGIVVACLVSVLLVSIGIGFTLLYFCYSKLIVVDIII